MCAVLFALLFHRRRIVAAGAAVSREKELLAVLFSISFNVAGNDGVHTYLLAEKRKIALGDHGLLLARWIYLLRARDIYVYSRSEQQSICI